MPAYACPGVHAYCPRRTQRTLLRIVFYVPTLLTSNLKPNPGSPGSPFYFYLFIFMIDNWEH